MNEYEIVDAMAGLQNNLIQAQAITITMLSAYMVVAYTVGEKLTNFQRTFVSVMFLVIGLIGTLGQISNLGQMSYYGAQLSEVRGGYGFTAGGGSFGEVAEWLFVVIRVLLFASALYFMWSIRHPKTVPPQ